MGPTRPRPLLPLLLLLVLTIAATGGCAVDMGTDRPTSPIGVVLADCVVPLPDRGPPVGVEYDDGSLWIFGDGTGVFAPTAAAACAGDLTTWPQPVVALTAAEEADNAARTDGRRLAIHPKSGVVVAGTAWLYYDLVLEGPGIFDAETVATAVCPISGRPGTCARGAGTLWPGLGHEWAESAFVAGDQVYAMGCNHVAVFTDLCALARAPVDRIDDPTAYTYLGWNDAWDRNDRNTVTLFEAPAAVTADYHGYSQRYLTTVADIWDSRLELRSAPAPGGPWSQPVVLFDVASPAGWFFAGGHEHAGLRADGGRTLAFSYYTTAASNPGLHLVRFRLDGTEVDPW